MPTKRKTKRRGKTATTGVPYSGSYTNGAPFTDAWNKNRAPTPIELLRENLGTAYACATLNADLIASTPLRLYIKTRNGEGKSRLSLRGDTRPVSAKSIARLNRYASKAVIDAKDVEEVTNHPALALLDRPNRANEDGVGMSGFNIFNLTQQFQEIVGRCYWWIEKKGLGNTPSAIWILAPQRMLEMPGYGKDQKIIEYYQFGGGNGTQRYETDEIAPFRMPDLYNVYSGGVAPLRAVFEQVRLSRKVDAQTNATLDNGGKPSAIWSPSATGDAGGFIGAPEAERMRRAMRQAFSMAGAGGIMVAETAGALSLLNWPMSEIIEAARIELSQDIICSAFNVPTTKVKRNDANLASSKTGDYAHAKDAGLPRCRRNEAALNTFYLPMWGPEAAERLFFAYDDPPGLNDEDAERLEFKDAATMGAATRNEYRARINLPPEPWGDQPLAPTNMAAVDIKTGIPDKTSLMDSTLLNLGKSIGQQAEATRNLESKIEAQNERASHPSGNGKAGDADADGNRRAAADLAGKRPANSSPVQGRANGRDDAGRASRLRNFTRQDRAGINSEIGLRKTGGSHDYSCVMARLPENAAAAITLAASMIPDDELTEDGRETDPHVTVLYGLDGATADQVAEVLKSEPPIRLSFGNIVIFEDDGERGSDVIVLSVSSSDLARLNEKLKASLPHVNTHPFYTPHATLAYVKPGDGEKYADKKIIDGEFVIDRVVFSDANNAETLIRLEGSKSKTAKADITPVRTMPSGAGIKSVLLKAFGEQRQAVMNQLEDHHAAHDMRSSAVPSGAKAGSEGDAGIPPKLPESFVALDTWTEKIARESKPVIEVIMRQQGNTLLTRVGASPDVFSVFDKNVPEAAEKLTLKFAESTNATTSMQLDTALSKLRTEISEGIIEGDTRIELRRRVQEVFDQADNVRAQRIADTEASRAAHNGELTSAKDSKVVSGKAWLASSDACAICQEFAAQGTIGLDKSFGADDYGIIDAPPGHINCQCSVSYSVKDDQT